MRHINTISRSNPTRAQFEPLLQLAGLFSALLGILQQFGMLFGVDFSEKYDTT